MISRGHGTFSADVKLHLYASNHCYELGHLGPDFAVLDTPHRIDTGDAELETIIDGQATRWPIRIVNATNGQSSRVTFEAV